MTIKKFAYLLAAGVVLLASSVILTAELHWADFHVYYSAGHSLLSGRTDLYAADFADSQIMDYRYPLFFLVLFLPFCWLPYQTAEFVWLWLNITIIYLTVAAIKRSANAILPEPVRFNLIAVLASIICAKYFIVSMRILNVHIIVLCMVFAAFYLLLKQKPAAAAVLMALAITFKIVPIIILPYFALKKQWSFLTLVAVFVIVLNLLPAVYFGFNTNFEMLRDWYRHVMIDNEFHNINGPINVSLQGQLERYLTYIDYSKRIEDPLYENVNLLLLPERVVSASSKVIALLMTAITAFVIWFLGKSRKKIILLNDNSGVFDAWKQHPRKSEASFTFDSLAFHEFGLMICLMLLIEPRSNVYYFLALFFPLVPFLHSFMRDRSRINVAAFSFVLTATCALPLLPGSYSQRLLLVLGVDFYIALVLWLALGYNLIRESQKLKNNRKTNFYAV